MKKSVSNNVKWHLNVKRPGYLLDLSLVLAGDLRELDELISFAYSQVFAIMENGQVEWYAPKKEVDQQVKELVKDLDQTAKIISLLPQYQSEVDKSLKNLIQEIKAGRYSVASFNRFFKVYRRFPSFRIITRIVGYHEDLPKEFVEMVSKVRLDFKNAWIRIRNNLEEVWALVAKEYKVSKETIKSLTYNEFLYYLKRKDFTQASIKAQKRKEKFVFYKDKKLEQFFFDTEVIEFINKSLGEQKVKKVRTLKGQTACSGKFQGVVEVILNPDKVKINQKIVLVTTMTTPQFIPLLRNVGAIITDEGGLTCHAAIISREMNVPCIIGTKVATKILKDGDMVEVDATKGVIKKI